MQQKTKQDEDQDNARRRPKDNTSRDTTSLRQPKKLVKTKLKQDKTKTTQSNSNDIKHCQKYATPIQAETRQAKTRQVKTRQDKIRQAKTKEKTAAA